MMTGPSESDIQTAIERHYTRNRELKQLIASKGIDLALPLSIDLHFWAFSEAAAHNLARGDVMGDVGENATSAVVGSVVEK